MPGKLESPMSTSRPASDKEVLITRVFDAPRDVVFAAWTDRAHLNNWFAPNGCTVEFRTIDVRPGGRFHSCIRTPDGKECWCIGDYREIVPPSRIVHTMAIADASGRPTNPVAAGMDPQWPLETTVTVTFEDVGGKTRVTLHQTVSETLAKRTGAHPSWLQMLDRLAQHIAKK